MPGQVYGQLDAEEKIAQILDALSECTWDHHQGKYPEEIIDPKRQLHYKIFPKASLKPSFAASPKSKTLQQLRICCKCLGFWGTQGKPRYGGLHIIRAPTGGVQIQALQHSSCPAGPEPFHDNPRCYGLKDFWTLVSGTC
ncbi:unnamed protein product [Symbiodinium natans]|uniref:Uncharacterized protein n=1 Tax=Symbiodinium natans TaxID=878477 RepID=A0A812RT48_9DINO|nr:unnamed protein product [Symbiodinium natans]